MRIALVFNAPTDTTNTVSVMTCVNPNYIRVQVDEYGTLHYTFRGSARYEDARDFGTYDDLFTRGWFNVLVPCRHCLGCRIDYSREWANRMCLELKDNPSAIFVTLTYSDEHLPRVESSDSIASGSVYVSTLSKRDCQLFMKRLRKAYPTKRIRYYLVGEYGKRFSKRPHYHAIIYGLSLLDFTDLKYHCKNEMGQISWRSASFEKIWENQGICTLSEVNYKTCAYVARYTLKKHYGYQNEELTGRLPEFSLCSRRPGIGLEQYEKYVSSESDFITYSTSDGVHTIPVPKSILRAAKDHDFLVDKVSCMQYNKLNNSSMKLSGDLAWSEKTFHEYLVDNYSELRERINLLKER